MYHVAIRVRRGLNSPIHGFADHQNVRAVRVACLLRDSLRSKHHFVAGTFSSNLICNTYSKARDGEQFAPVMIASVKTKER